MKCAAAPLLLLTLLGACARRDQAGLLTAAWTSADTTIGSGKMAVAATANWCQSVGRLTVLGAGTDSGVAVLYRSDAVRGGNYPIVDTTMSRAPSAVVAVRFVRGMKVLALSSDSGSLVLEPRSSDDVSGRFSAWFRETGTASPVEVSGQFTNVPIASDSAACAVAPPPTP